MSLPALVARIRASESPAVWMAAVGACRVARRLSRHRSRWSSRLGYALDRLDQARESRRTAEAYRARLALPGARAETVRRLRLARRHERRREWDAAAAAYRRVLQDDESLAPVWYRLGWCLWRLGDAAGAAGALDEACRRDGSDPHRFGLLADALEVTGDLAAAARARQEVVRLTGHADPRPRLALANLYDRVGQWADAQRVLRENAEQHPDHAATHRRLGEVSLALARWGGSFTGTLAGRDAGGFRFDQPAGAAAATARQALERAAALEPAKTAWREALAEARLADGDLRGAAALYEAALRHADESTGKWVLAVKQRWQFALESIHHRLGAPRVEDPLFECTVQAGPTDGEVSRVAGLFSVATTFGGLTVSGLLAVDDADHVEIVLDGQPLRSLKAGGDGFFRQFHIEIKRSTLALFPAKARLEVRLPDGTPLHTTGGAQLVHLAMPHGDGTLPTVLAAGGKVDKKGTISLSAEAARQRQDRYLQLYARARDFFEERLGRSLFLLYGTLLGLHRDGDFIPGDDDFDAGYVSDHTDPRAVKEETKRLVVELVKAGFTVSFNRKGRLFRLQWEHGDTDGLHLDVRPVWFQNGRVWLHNHCSFPARRVDFLPVADRQLRGTTVRVPRDTEKFLRGHYGPGWTVPDPGFSYHLSEIDPAVLENLSLALIGVREYRELAERVRREVGDSPQAGRLVSIGSQDLYPLDRFLP